MLKVISREFVGIWLAGPTQTVIVSNQQCGQSPAVDGKNSLCIRSKDQIVSSTCLCTRYSFCGRTAEKVHKVVRSKRRINHIKSNSEYLLYCLYNFCIDWLIGYYCEKYQKKCKVTYNHVFFCRSIVK